MKNLCLGLSLLSGMGLAMVGCGSDSGSGGTGPCASGEVECDGVCIPEIATTLDGVNGIQASVFDGSCAFTNCHGDMGLPGGGLVLSSVEESEMNLINVASTQITTLDRVEPGDVSTSYIVNKLLGEGIQEGTSRMPIAVDPLCDSKIDAVEAWIAAGAN